MVRSSAGADTRDLSRSPYPRGVSGRAIRRAVRNHGRCSHGLDWGAAVVRFGNTESYTSTVAALVPATTTTLFRTRVVPTALRQVVKVDLQYPTPRQEEKITAEFCYDSVQAIAARHELHPNQVSAWKRQLLDAAPEVFAMGAARKLAQQPRRRSTTCTPRSAHRRAFFGAGCSAEPGGPGASSRSRQCLLLNVAVLPAEGGERGEPGADAAHGRPHGVPVLQHAPSPPRGRHGGPAPDPAAHMGMEAVYRRPRTSVASPEHRIFPYLRATSDFPGGPRVVRGHHLCPCQRGFFYLVAVMDWATRHVLQHDGARSA